MPPQNITAVVSLPPHHNQVSPEIRPIFAYPKATTTAQILNCAYLNIILHKVIDDAMRDD